MKAKYTATLVLCFLIWRARAQQDTLFYDDPHKAVDYIMENMNRDFYESKLLERSLSDFSFTYQQAQGNYNQIFDGLSWLQLYSDVHYAYLDSAQTLSNDSLIHSLFNFFETSERNSTTDELQQPFGLLLHRLNRFDSSVVYNGGVSVQNNQFIAQVPQQNLYQPVLIKSAALLEFYGESGYATGKLVYDERFVSTSNEIVLNSIQINVGNGFENFGPANPVLEYNRSRDSTVAHVAINYTLDGGIVNDTLPFYLTTTTGNSAEPREKASEWSDEFDYDHDNTGVKFHIGVKYGCGNSTSQARRPFIIAPPYRPSTQMVSMNTYYDQFNIYGLFDLLTGLGYDVYFIKVKPGNNSLEESGVELANFFNYINEQKADNYAANFPGESWENIVMGFSAGGQIARYGLMYAEKMHMEQGWPHPHARMYISFDSPHWGASIPMFAQTSMYELQRMGNILAGMVYQSMIDDGSKDMMINHILASNLTEVSNFNWQMYPHQTPERDAFVNMLNVLPHAYTHTEDLRKSFPAFTRNIAISTGRNDKNYSEEFGLTPNLPLFEQNTPILLTQYGLASKHRIIFSSRFGISQLCFFDYETYIFSGILPITNFRIYNTNLFYEWDAAQGGYKDEFYDKDYGAIPISPVGIMRISGWLWGDKHYNGHVSFLPLVSALGINPSIWQNNNLLYNLKDKGLMYQHRDIVNTPKSNFFGYPNLGHPNDHFNITPFEAVCASPHTYEHIKIVASADANHLEYIDSLRNFILNEVEPEVVYLQNKVIGQNHVIGDPSFRYKAWYKARKEIHAGANVTPKTDIGDYVIQASGDIVFHAAEEIVLEPGFSVEEGATFEAAIAYDNCYVYYGIASHGDEGATMLSAKSTQEEMNAASTASIRENESIENTIQLFPNPNNGSFMLQLPDSCSGGSLYVSDVLGKQVYTESIRKNRTELRLNIPKGIYFLHYNDKTTSQTLQFIVQ